MKGPNADEALRARLLDLLEGYRARYPDEAALAERFARFVTSGETLQGRDNSKRHITASSWVVDPSGSRVILTHHAKLDRWVQLGGHVDPGEDWHSAAWREAREESGLETIESWGARLFDLDIHGIPARPDTPAHEHWDLRFVFRADPATPLLISDESHDLAWVPLQDLEKYTREESQLRMRTKTARWVSEN